jgi:hypothetical protein
LSVIPAGTVSLNRPQLRRPHPAHPAHPCGAVLHPDDAVR